MRSFYVISANDKDYFALQLHGDEVHFQKAIYALHKEDSVLGFYIEDLEHEEKVYYWCGKIIDMEQARREYGLPGDRAGWYEDNLIDDLIVLKNGDIVPMDNYNYSLKEMFHPKYNNYYRKR